MQHGLITPSGDQSTGILWFAGSTNFSTGATGIDIGTGTENTFKIITSQAPEVMPHNSSMTFDKIF